MSRPSTPGDTGGTGDVVEPLLARAPTLGDSRLLCIDGPSGSGKTTLAAAVARDLEARGRGPVRSVHLDDLYPGWDGLGDLDGIVEPMLRDLAAGRAGSYVRWDWEHDRPAGAVTVAPAPVVVLEGVGAGDRAWADLCTLLVWIELRPVRARVEAVLARDGNSIETQIHTWIRKERAHFSRQHTKSRAAVCKTNKADISTTFRTS